MASTPTITPESSILSAGPPSVSTVHVPPSAPVRPEPSLAPPWLMHRFSVDEYERMVCDGILSENDRVELLDGWIVCKMSRTPAHDAILARLIRYGLIPHISATHSWRGQSAIRLSRSEPEPDIAVVRGGEFDYLNRHPGPSDIELVIEISATSLPEDRKIKGPLYAFDRIAVYWIVSLEDSQIEVHSEPSGPSDTPGYAVRRVFTKTDSVPLVLEGKVVAEIPVRELLP